LNWAGGLWANSAVISMEGFQVRQGRRLTAALFFVGNGVCLKQQLHL
jgi:hypothetical protein